MGNPAFLGTIRLPGVPPFTGFCGVVGSLMTRMFSPFVMMGAAAAAIPAAVIFFKKSRLLDILFLVYWCVVALVFLKNRLQFTKYFCKYKMK